MSTEPTFRIHGSIVDKNTSRPLPGLHVRAYDKDIIWDDLLGNDYTDSMGTFRITFFEHDFKEIFEGQPEIYIVAYINENEEVGRSGPFYLPEGQNDMAFHIAIDAGNLITDPLISRVIPQYVLPGTFVQIEGANFGNNYQDVLVTLGGREALVLDVAPNRLLVRVPVERGDLEPIVVNVDGKTAEIKDVLKPAEIPRQGEVGAKGAPETFYGTEEGAAGLSNTGLNQNVLIIFCHPSDHSPTDGGLSADQERQRQIDVFEKLVNPAVMQMSFNRVSFNFDYTDWLALPETDDFYFWRQSDIDTAQAALDALPVDATEEEKIAAEDKLRVAKELIDIAQEGDELYHDALKAAENARWDLANFKGIMLCVVTGFLRGQYSGNLNSITDSDGDTVILSPNTSLWLISYVSHWGRRIHELCHAIASPDLYGGIGLISDGEWWDMMGQHNQMPLFSGYNMANMLGWYDGANVCELPSWNVTPSFDQTYTLKAHGATEDASAATYHLLKLEVFPGLTYYVEVRQEPESLPVDLDTDQDLLAVLAPAAAVATASSSQRLFDARLKFPGIEPSHKGGLIATKVVDGVSGLNQNYRFITLLTPDLLQEGGEVVDAARRLTIRAVSKTNDRPLTYMVRVSWVDVAPEDPNGLLNLRIRPWDSSYQSPDIWVDSEHNSWGAYETPLEPGTGNPTGNGDRPWVNNWNRICARVHNFGVIDASDVQVTFYVNSPPGIGDSGTWVPHAVRTIPGISAGSSEPVQCDWFPVSGEHTCIRVAVETQIGETDVDDNQAQENVFTFDTIGSSPHKPIFFETLVQNPLKKWSLIHLHVKGLPPGWETTLENGWVWLPPLGTKPMRIAIFTDLGRKRPLARYLRPQDKKQDIPKEIKLKIEGAVYRWYGEGPNKRGLAEHLASIGGINVAARARKGADLSLEASPDAGKRGYIQAFGTIKPQIANVVVNLRITGQDKRRVIVPLITDAEGRFEFDSMRNKQFFGPGDYELQAFIINDKSVAATESGIARVSVGLTWSPPR